MILVAHRGRIDPVKDRENALSQMKTTLTHGITMMEMDLRRSKDGTIYLLHDASLDRTTSEKGPIIEKSDTDLNTARLLPPGGPISDEPITKFDQIIALAEADRSFHLMLDIKAVDPRDLVPLLQQHNLEAQSMIITFDRDTAEKALSFNHDVLTSVLVTSPVDIDFYLALAGRHQLAFYVPQAAHASLFIAAHQTGRPVVTDAITDEPGGSLDQKAMISGSDVYRTFLQTRPVDYFVTDHSLTVKTDVCGRQS